MIKLSSGESHVKFMKEQDIHLTLVDEVNSMHGDVYWIKNVSGDHFVILEQFGDRLFKECEGYDCAKEFMQLVISKLTDDDVSDLFLE